MSTHNHYYHYHGPNTNVILPRENKNNRTSVHVSMPKARNPETAVVRYVEEQAKQEETALVVAPRAEVTYTVELSSRPPASMRQTPERYVQFVDDWFWDDQSKRYFRFITYNDGCMTTEWGPFTASA